jgi:hypothetical protein
MSSFECRRYTDETQERTNLQSIGAYLSLTKFELLFVRYTFRSCQVFLRFFSRKSVHWTAKGQRKTAIDRTEVGELAQPATAFLTHVTPTELGISWGRKARCYELV